MHRFFAGLIIFGNWEALSIKLVKTPGNVYSVDFVTLILFHNRSSLLIHDPPVRMACPCGEPLHDTST